MRVCVCVYVCVCVDQPLRTSRMRHKVDFLAKFNWFEFRVFL